MATVFTRCGTSALRQPLGTLNPVRIGALTGSCLAAAFIGYSSSCERRWLAVTHQQVVVPDVSPAWDGLRLVHLSDFHLGALGTPHAMLRRVIAATLALHPDLIVLTGDYSHDGRPQPLDLLAPLARTAPTFAVLGNHDYFQGAAGADHIAANLERFGITVLRNAMADFVHNGVVGRIAGVDQANGHARSTVDRLLLQVAEHRPQIALVHEPDIIERFPTRSAGLTLAGHTHGAQVRLSPVRQIDWIRWSPSANHSHYPRGWFTVKGNQLYVTRGLGISFLPLRFAARPELVSFTLRATVCIPVIN